MPRYLVERSFADGLQIPMTDAGVATILGVVDHNGDLGVTWLHSYVSDDKRTTFCVSDGPDVEVVTEPGTEVILEPGDAIFYEDDVVHTARGAGDAEALVFGTLMLTSNEPLLMPSDLEMDMDGTPAP